MDLIINNPMIDKNDYVMLLHGLGRTAKSMQKLANFLTQQEYTVINVDYPSRKEKIENLAKDLKKVIEKKCKDKNKKIHFVTHSMGGIIVRYLLAIHTVKNIGKIVMLAPPNKGSKYANFFSKLKIANWILGPSLKQMTTANESLSNSLPNTKYDIGIIAGKYDGKVTIDQTKLKNMKDFIIVPKMHTYIMNDDKVLSAIDNFLQQGSFKKSYNS